MFQAEKDSLLNEKDFIIKNLQEERNLLKNKQELHLDLIKSLNEMKEKITAFAFCNPSVKKPKTSLDSLINEISSLKIEEETQQQRPFKVNPSDPEPRPHGNRISKFVEI